MIFGYGGCGFYGLVYVVVKRGFIMEVYVSYYGLLFVEGVCNESKK